MSISSYSTARALSLLAVGLVLPSTVDAQTFGTRDPESPMLALGAETGFTGASVYHLKAEGADFLTAGVTTRMAGFNAAQSEPFQLFVPDVPSGCNAVAAFVSWNFLHDTPPQATKFLDVNGNVLSGNFAGSGTPDLCWGLDNGTSYLLEIDPALLVLGGLNTFAGATDGNHGPNSLGEGLHVLVVYECPGAEERSVDVYAGYTSTESAAGNIARVELPFTQPHPGLGVACHFFVNALDGQTMGAGDDFAVNGIPASGVIAGTGAPGDAWKGQLGHDVVPLVDWLHDEANDDIADFMPFAGSNGLIAETSPTGGDCIGHSFAAVSFPVCSTSPAASPRTCGTNPAIYTVTSLPRIGSNFIADVDVSPKGHALAVLVGYSAPLTLDLGPCRCLLVDITSPQVFSLAAQALPATFTTQVPADLDVCGEELATQALLFGGGVPFALTNANDLTVGR